jgi:glucose-1-phosphate cytidylyltransferase
MKVVILAGGLGTRLSEETAVKPKPMVEVGGHPILWHIMKIYAAHGLTDFVICLGYRGYAIKQYFADYVLHNSDVTFDLATNQMLVHRRYAEPWRVTLVDTGAETMTGGRLRRVREYLDKDEPFCFTYGDGVGNVDIQKLLAFHREQGRLATLTAVRPPGRFGVIALKAGENTVTRFREKPQGDGAWVNGGFFVLHPSVIDYIDGDATVWEAEPLERLAADGQLVAFRHDGFWQPMDTLRDRKLLEDLWAGGKAPWKVWKDEPAPSDGATVMKAFDKATPVVDLSRRQTEVELETGLVSNLVKAKSNSNGARRARR